MKTFLKYKATFKSFQGYTRRFQPDYFESTGILETHYPSVGLSKYSVNIFQLDNFICLTAPFSDLVLKQFCFFLFRKL